MRNDSASVIYFAYGNNMSSSAMEKLGEHYEVMGPACLPDYRLAFTRYSLTWKAGVADIIQKPFFCVWGVLYRVSSSALAKIDEKEGAHLTPPAYVQKIVSVDLYEKQEQVDDKHLIRTTRYEAITYEVQNKNRDDSGRLVELPPAVAYIRSLIEGASENNIYSHYVKFLRNLEREKVASFRTGYLVMPTILRDEARGIPIVRMNTRMQYSKDHFCVLEHGDRTALAVLVHDPNLEPEICQLDQSIRHCLGILGRYVFGSSVQIVNTDCRAYFPLSINTRALSLPVAIASALDMEKKIVTLHPKNIALLGISEGDYVKILAPQRINSGQYVINSIERRVYAGSPAPLHKLDNTQVEYPDQSSVYVDLDGRKALNVEIDVTGVGALVKPSTRKLFTANVTRYGLTLGVGILAIFPIIQAMQVRLGYGNFEAAVVTVIIAFIITVIFTILDLRSKLRY